MKTTQPPTAEPQVKGVAFRSVLAVAEQLEGEAFVERTLAGMNADEARLLRFGLAQSGWYPISLYRALWKALLANSGGGYELARKIGAGAIKRDVTGVYRVLFKVLSVDTLLTLSTKLFGYYYTTGSLVNRRAATHRIRNVYEGCAGFDRAMWEELAGSCQALVTMAGKTNVRVTVVSGGLDGSTNCVMDVEWD